jgi:hypothetical protein
MNIYIACGLTHVPRSEFVEYVDFINGLARELTTNCSADVRYALRDSDPQLAEKPFEDRARLCYLWDREMVERSDLVIAEASFPSTGLGIELQIAEAMDIPIIIAFKQASEHRAPPVDYATPDGVEHSLQLGEGFVSLMALGLPSVFRVVAYTESSTAYAALAKIVLSLTK